MTDIDAPNEFFDLAMKQIGERATPEESRALKVLIAARPDLAEELDRLRSEVPIGKEVLMLLNATEATEGEIPEYALERLQTKVSRTFSQGRRGRGAGKRFWWLGLGVGALTVLTLSTQTSLFFVGAPKALDRAITKTSDRDVYGLRGFNGFSAAFETDHITKTFLASAPQVTSTHGNILEVATAQSTETFTRSDSSVVLGSALGTITSQIRVPVTFRYHIRLSDRWQLSTRGNVCVVVAPNLRPSLPPAIHTDQIEKKTEAGWLRFNSQASLQALERTISPTLGDRASDVAHIGLAREMARKSVAEFVKNWLLREDQWRSDRFTAIIVAFEDEVVSASPVGETLDPTLKL